MHTETDRIVEEAILDLIMREERARRELGYPEHIIRSASVEIREAATDGRDFVGAVRGLRWSEEEGWQ